MRESGVAGQMQEPGMAEQIRNPGPAGLVQAGSGWTDPGRIRKVRPARPGGQGWGLSVLVSSADVPSERCPEQVLGRVGGRAGGDRMSVGPVDLAEAYAVERNPGVMCRKLQLPGRLAEINPARASVLAADHVPTLHHGSIDPGKIPCRRSLMRRMPPGDRMAPHGQWCP
jgi:hypothetical protein